MADIVGDAGVVLLNRAPGTAILNERMVFVGMDEAGSGALQGHALAEYFWETDHGTDIRYLLFQGMPGQENTDARSGTAVQSLLDDGFCPIAAADYQVCGFSRLGSGRGAHRQRGPHGGGGRRPGERQALYDGGPEPGGPGPGGGGGSRQSGPGSGL